MKVGIPREVKNHEYRVAITPAGVHAVVSGLVSTASPDGTAATGVDGISAVGGTMSS